MDSTLATEFMSFLVKYNIIGVAIGLVIATKVNDFVKSLIEDVFVPLVLQPVFKRLKVDHLEQLSYKGILYGKALARMIDFLITALIVFLVIKYVGITL